MTEWMDPNMSEAWGGEREEGDGGEKRGKKRIASEVAASGEMYTYLLTLPTSCFTKVCR